MDAIVTICMACLICVIAKISKELVLSGFASVLSIDSFFSFLLCFSRSLTLDFRFQTRSFH